MELDVVGGTNCANLRKFDSSVHEVIISSWEDLYKNVFRTIVTV